jgi:WD40 repeat protein
MAAAEASPTNSPEKAGDKDARAVSLQYRHVFGLKANVKGTVHFTEETHVLYPAGHNTILYDQAQKTQTRFFSGSEGSEGISCLAVSPNKKFLAVCEKFQDRAICSIFDVNTGKRRRGTLSFADCDAKEFVYAAFSGENKFLITQGGPPDFTLILWSWDKARPHGSVKVSNITGSTIHECSFNPQDSSLVCVVGDGIFKFFRLQEGTFKNIPNQLSKLRETSNQNYVCHAWVHNQDRLVVCTESGDALLFDNGGEFKMVLPCSPQEMGSLRCIAPYSKGFVTGGDNGVIRVFEHSDDVKEMYKNTKQVKVDGGNGQNAGSVTSLAVSLSEEMLAVATSSSQLLQVSLSPSDIMKTEESTFDYVLTSFHSGPILGLDVCVRKPLVVTCGIDKSVRVWNYQDKTQELCKFFGEEAYSVAFHPSGFHLIVGFSDKLRLMNVIMEDMRTYKEVPIKGCKECRFSHGGQFFAAVNSNTIQIYKTYTCEVVCNLRGHQSKVRSVCWTADDSRIVSTGADGAAYEYDIVKEGRRCSEWAQKGTNFSCIIAYTDTASQKNTMYAVGSDKMIKEVQDSQLTNYLESNVTIGQLALANSAKVLFAGVMEPEVPGPLRCYNFPLDGDYVECQAHSEPVSRIRITCDDQYLFSTGDDGCLYIFDVKKKAPSKRDKDGALGFADEILVTRAFLDDKQASLLDLERQVEELTNRIDFQLRHRDSYHKEKMAELQEKYSEEIETERRKYEVLSEEKREMETEYEENIKNLEETHAKQTQELEQSFQQKMLVEVQRFQKLAQDLDREKQEWETQHGQLVQGHENVIDQMRMEFEKQQRSNWDERDRIVKEKEQAFKQHHETLAQLEQDADREIEELKEMYEEKLAQEKDEKVRLRGQAGIHRKHHDDLKRQMQKKQDDVRKEEERNRKNEERIGALLKDKESNEKEIKERDKTITDKETRIYDLKKQNQELEKFKFVLDYKIKELKAQIDPKNDDIASMLTQIQAMEGELDDYMRKNKQLALDISQLQMKQRALQEEIKSQKKRLRDDLALIKRFKLDLSECMECIAEPKQLKEAVANLYRKYVQSGVKKLDLDTDMQKEYNRQRDYLEKSVDSLKRKLEKDSQAHRTDNMRIMQENVQLIREINDLRREINVLKHERTAQELQAINQQAGGGTGSMAGSQAPNDATIQRDEIQALQDHLAQLEASAPQATIGGRAYPATGPAGEMPPVASQSPGAQSGGSGLSDTSPGGPEAPTGGGE